MALLRAMDAHPNVMEFARDPGKLNSKQCAHDTAVSHRRCAAPGPSDDVMGRSRPPLLHSCDDCCHHYQGAWKQAQLSELEA
ncbi:unnamed protein product [Gadus morhua 'NCC']